MTRVYPSVVPNHRTRNALSGNNASQQEHSTSSLLRRQPPPPPSISPPGANPHLHIPAQGLHGPLNQTWSSGTKYPRNYDKGGLSPVFEERSVRLGRAGHENTSGLPRNQDLGLAQFVINAYPFFLRAAAAGIVDKDASLQDLELGRLRENIPHRPDMERVVDQLANRMRL